MKRNKTNFDVGIYYKYPFTYFKCTITDRSQKCKFYKSSAFKTFVRLQTL